MKEVSTLTRLLLLLLLIIYSTSISTFTEVQNVSTLLSVSNRWEIWAAAALLVGGAFVASARLSSALARSLISQMESWLVSWHLHGAMEHMHGFIARAQGNTLSETALVFRALLSKSFLMNKQFAKQAQMSAFLKCDSYLSSLNKRQATYEDPQGRFNGFWTYKGVLHPSRLIHVSSAWSSHERALGSTRSWCWIGLRIDHL